VVAPSGLASVPENSPSFELSGAALSSGFLPLVRSASLLSLVNTSEEVVELDASPYLKASSGTYTLGKLARTSRWSIRTSNLEN